MRYCFASPSGKIILLITKKMTIDTPPVRTVVRILYRKLGTPSEPATPTQMLLMELTTRVTPTQPTK